MNAAGKRPDVSKMRAVSPKKTIASGTCCRPRPTDSAVAKITMLRLFHLTSDSIDAPAAATIPNMTITPPPRTWIGIVLMIAPIFGTKPQKIRKIAPIVTTWRDITPVIAIRPTFWLNDVFGKEPNTPAIAVPKPSAKVAPVTSASVASRPAPPLVIPDTSPTVSIAEINAIKHMPMMIAQLIAKPNLNGSGRANTAASLIPARFTSPIR